METECTQTATAARLALEQVPHDSGNPTPNMDNPSQANMNAPAYTSVASAVATSSGTTLQQSVNSVSHTTSGNQNDSLADSTKISQLGANHAGTMGAYFCAEGATMIGKDDKLSASDFAACQKYFETADALKQKSGLKAIQPDAAVTDAEGAQGIMDAFHKRYGITGEDYLDRMLGAGGGRGELSEMLSKRLSSAALDQAFARADDVHDTGAADKFIVNLQRSSGVVAQRKVSSELRAQLKEKLAAPNEASHEAREARPAKEKLGHLEPMRAEDVFSGSEPKEKELTIFDVVRRKYHEISRRLGLVPFN